MTERPSLERWVLSMIAGFCARRDGACRCRCRSAPLPPLNGSSPRPGLEATLWASEPMLVNPTNIDVDSRGRVWVAEGLNYRLSRGGNRRFHRIEEADRIKILEDTDGDGKADKVTVFADRIFPVPMGIAVEEHHDKDGKYTGCRVFVGNSPDLLVLEDTDGDDKADKRYPLLTGFGGVDSDHGVHGMALGLDGKLYFTHGDGCCSVQHDHSERQQNFDVIDNGGPSRLDRPARQHDARQSRRHAVRDHLRPPAQQLRDVLELLRQHVYKRQRRRRQSRLPGDLGDGWRPLRLPHARQPAALGRGGPGQRPQDRRHRQRQPLRHHGL